MSVTLYRLYIGKWQDLYESLIQKEVDDVKGNLTVLW
jgi:hypothetical protein